jgi:SagB-type dehydrogenase family enzyme
VDSIIDNEKNGVSCLTFFLTAIIYRSAWKYRERSYRYHLLDTGHVLESLNLALSASGIAGVSSMDFDDERVNRFLGIDETREFTLAVVQIGKDDKPDRKTGRELLEAPALPGDILEASRVSARETAYPHVLSMHLAGTKRPAPRRNPSRPMVEHLGPAPDNWAYFAPPHSWPSDPLYMETVLKRRSRRNFIKQPITKDDLATVLECLFKRAESKREDPGVVHTVGVGLIIERVKGIPPGYYLVDPASSEIAQVREGSFTALMAKSSLDQAWLVGAAIHVLLMTNLEILDHFWGARGYRYAMVEAGRLGQKVYLAATALGLGCCGIGAFYDQEMADHLQLNASSRLLYLLGIGPVRSGINP